MYTFMEGHVRLNNSITAILVRMAATPRLCSKCRTLLTVSPCAQNYNGPQVQPSVGSSIALSVSSAYVDLLGDDTGGFADGVLTADEIAADPDAAALAAQLQINIASSLGLSPDDITISVCLICLHLLRIQSPTGVFILLPPAATRAGHRLRPAVERRGGGK